MNRITRGKGLFGSLLTSGLLKAGSLNLGTTTVHDIVSGTVLAVHGTILPGGIGTVNTVLANSAAGDAVIANPLTPTGGLVLAGVKAIAGTLTSYFVNPTSGTVSPGTFSMTVTRLDLTA